MTLDHSFQLFTAIMALACIALEATILKPRERWDLWLFWTFGTAFIAFSALRPLGAGVDDIYGYATAHSYTTDQFIRVCPSLSCGTWIQGDRDQAWYSLVGLLKSIYPSPRVQLLLVAAGLSFKLWVISKLTQHRSLALLVYAACFYIIHDITALRVSLAISVYLGAFYLLVRKCNLSGGLGLAVNGLFHKQAFVAPLLFLGYWIPWSRPRVFFIMLPMGLLMTGIYPDDSIFEWAMSFPGGGDVVNTLFGENYVYSKLTGGYENVRIWPIVVPPTVILAVWLIRDLEPKSLLLKYSATSLLLAVLSLWGYAVIPEVQLRFWHFFLVPIVFVVGNVRLNSLKLAAILMLSAIYIIKYTALHDLLLDQRSFSASASLGGIVQFFSAGAFVDDQSRNFNFGKKVEVRATPSDGYRFGYWLGDCSGAAPVCFLDMNQNRRVKAYFIKTEDVLSPSEKLSNQF